jgi:hypothetical protein
MMTDWLEGYLTDIEDAAKKVLRDAGLPDYDGTFVRYANGAWEDIEKIPGYGKMPQSKVTWVSEGTMIPVLIDNPSEGPYSKEWIAANLLKSAARVREAYGDGDLDGIAATMVFLEKYRAVELISTYWEKDAAIGKQRRRQQIEFAGRRASDLQEERSPEWEHWQSLLNAMIGSMPNPPKSKRAKAKLLKSKHNIPDSIETIRKRIT